ncbi:hypothetical protein ABPG77_007836 [Micractinium sp. CCAP 211/92]
MGTRRVGPPHRVLTCVRGGAWWGHGGGMHGRVVASGRGAFPDSYSTACCYGFGGAAVSEHLQSVRFLPVRLWPVPPPRPRCHPSQNALLLGRHPARCGRLLVSPASFIALKREAAAVAHKQLCGVQPAALLGCSQGSPSRGTWHLRFQSRCVGALPQAAGTG